MALIMAMMLRVCPDRIVVAEDLTKAAEDRIVEAEERFVDGEETIITILLTANYLITL